ncbi:MAG: DNA-3-methyladenine glycosylase [Cyclobacteriaceae bacterium]
MFDLTTYEKLPKSFYLRSDVVQIAKDLIGKVLFTNIGGILTAAKIVETEAYCGRNDRACHAFERRTKRTETMYGEGGVAYVYLCYGIHHLFNVVTNMHDHADAVLIRAAEPIIGIEQMQLRRKKQKPTQLTSGPGVLSQALGISTTYNEASLVGEEIWIGADRNQIRLEIEIDRRVGVDYAGEDALLPWRFMLRESEYVSVKKRNL